MRKLTLHPERLTVESFTVAGVDALRGTVAARELAATPACPVTQTDCQTNLVDCPSRVVSQCTCVVALC
ncbi:MAG TPA: hypothetical protein VFJ82_04490 [Longimicrobium sp.]|nr:hypothetical protein [Longimicrobium sp.]